MTWECKHGHGPISHGDFVRMPEGSETFYQVPDVENLAPMTYMLTSTATRAGARVVTRSIWGFESQHGKPVYFVFAKVVKQGRARQPHRKRANSGSGQG